MTVLAAAILGWIVGLLTVAAVLWLLLRTDPLKRRDIRHE